MGDAARSLARWRLALVTLALASANMTPVCGAATSEPLWSQNLGHWPAADEEGVAGILTSAADREGCIWALGYSYCTPEASGELARSVVARFDPEGRLLWQTFPATVPGSAYAWPRGLAVLENLTAYVLFDQLLRVDDTGRILWHADCGVPTGRSSLSVSPGGDALVAQRYYEQGISLHYFTPDGAR